MANHVARPGWDPISTMIRRTNPVIFNWHHCPRAVPGGFPGDQRCYPQTQSWRPGHGHVQVNCGYLVGSQYCSGRHDLLMSSMSSYREIVSKTGFPTWGCINCLSQRRMFDSLPERPFLDCFGRYALFSVTVCLALGYVKPS